MIGVDCLKKIVSLIISLFLIVGIVPINVSGTVPANMSIDEFSKQVRQMITEYDVVKNNQETLSVQSFSADSDEDYSEFETMRLIVKSKSKIDTLDAVSVISGYKDLWVLQFESEYYTAEAFEYYSALECVEYVEPDNIITKDTVVDTFSTEKLENGHLSWGSEAIGSDEVLDYLEIASVDLAEVKVGVIDTGIDYNHEFLKSRMVDEGLNFSASGDNTAMSDDPDSHGTHVSGIIVDNSPKTVKIKGYKIFDSKGETTNLIIATAINKAVADGMDILNLSYGGSNSNIETEALINAHNNGVILVAAAGNDGTDISGSLPADFKDAITVAAVDKKLKRVNWSCFGDNVDLAAPGVDIKSSLCDNQYGEKSGTSMAAPFVTASAAILLSLNPKTTPFEIEKTLKNNAIEIKSDKMHNYTGSGLVNISGSVDFKRTSTPKTFDSGEYSDCLTIDFEADIGVEIYYTLDGSIPTKFTGILYNEPFVIDTTSDLNWVAYKDGELRSTICSETYRIIEKADEDFFTINESGEIIDYCGTYTDMIIPNTINGISVSSVGEAVFSKENLFAYGLIGVELPDTVKSVGKNSFNGNETLKYFKAIEVREINDGAFQNCINLRTVTTPNVVSIGDYSYAGCTMLRCLDSVNVESVGDYAFMGNASITELNWDRLIFVGYRAFERSSLRRVVFKNLTTLKRTNGFLSNPAFYLCDNLKEIYLPQLTSIGQPVNEISGSPFRNLSSLETFYAPKLELIKEYMFCGDYNLKNINIESATSVQNYAFEGCTNLKTLYLPNVKYVGEDVFRYSAVENIFFGALEETYSIPVVDSIIAIPSTATVIEENRGGAHLKIYGTKGTYAEEWANGEHKYCTSEFISLPLITDDLPAELSENEGKLTIDAIGFNLSYQWYGSIDGTTENAVVLEGENNEELVIENTEKFKGYYCVVNGEDGEFITSVTSNVALIKYNSADYAEYDAAIASVPAILSIYTEESVAKLQDVLSVDVSGKLSYEQNIVDEQTKAILNVISELELKSADYSQLDKVLETIPDDLSIYTDESLAKLNDVLDSIDKNLDITNQSQIDEWAKQVETAVKNLKIKPADYTALDEVISKIPDNFSLYTDESVMELEKILNSIDRELDITQQEQVDNYVTAIEQAITKLNYKSADYSLVFDAIATIPEDLSIYTPESVEALECIIEGIDYSLDITQQEKVDEYAVQIKQSVENLEEECWLVRLFRVIISFLKDIILCLKNYVINIFYC